MHGTCNLQIVVITQMGSMSVVPVTPRETLQCLPIFVAFDHSAEGHYDAVAHSRSHSVSTETQSCSVSSIKLPILNLVVVVKAQEKKNPISPLVITSKKGASVFKV